MRLILLSVAALMAAQMVSAQGLKQGTLTNVTRLTNSAEKYENPRWSPDGKKIAYSREGLNCLYVMDATGANARMLSDGAGAGYMFEWSADSREILTTEVRRERSLVGASIIRHQAAWAVSLDGKKTRMTDDVARMKPASWRYNAAGVKTVVAPGAKLVTGVKLAPLAKAKAKAVAANDAQKVSAMVDGDALYVVDAQGRTTKIFEGHSFCPAVSPDGKKIAFNHVNKVCVINIDGTGMKELGRGFNPCWVNGRQIVFEHTTDDGHKYTSGELMMVNADGTGLKQITATPGIIERCPAVSADGSKLLFVSHNDGQIYSADLK